MCISVIHPTLTWTTRSLMCVHDHLHACVYTRELGTPTTNLHMFHSEKLSHGIRTLGLRIWSRGSRPSFVGRPGAEVFSDAYWLYTYAERYVEHFTITTCSEKLVLMHNVSLRIREVLGPRAGMHDNVPADLCQGGRKSVSLMQLSPDALASQIG